MISYTTVGTNDMERAAAFYDELFALLGAKRVVDNERLVFWANSPDTSAFAIAKPFDGNEASVGNGVMIALHMKDPEQVKQVHQKALELGATDEGAPGPRGDADQFYCGYFRDLDGNKLNAFCMNG